MTDQTNRRTFLSSLAAVTAGACVPAAAARAPVAPVALSRCKSYDTDLVPILDRMFDQIGGLGRIVKGKTVAVKLNLNGGPTSRLRHLPLAETHWPHPKVIGAMMHLMARAGAHRIRLLESTWAKRPDPLEENLYEANWDVDIFRGAAPKVEFENTNFLGSGKKYSRFKVPGGGWIYPAYDLNHSYEDCDVFVSIAKFKDHSTTGITTCMKNLFGMTPLTVYGTDAPVDEPALLPSGSRLDLLHYGKRQPPKSAPREIDPTSSRDDGYRLPRIVAELVAARPVHLSVLDGITTMAGGQNPEPVCEPVSPGVLLAGANVVSTAAVAMAVMNYDPMADRGTTPFETCDNKLKLAERLGVGSPDLSRIEVIGPPVREAVCDFKALRPVIAARRKALYGRG